MTLTIDFVCDEPMRIGGRLDFGELSIGRLVFDLGPPRLIPARLVHRITISGTSVDDATLTLAPLDDAQTERG